MSQPYCPACLCVLTLEERSCKLCKSSAPPDGWPQTTTFRYPWLGYLIDQRYRLVQYLGYGGMGDVYRAESQSVGVSFAAKVIDRRVVPSIQTIEDLAQRLDREVAAMAMLSSPHVTRVIDYFVMPEEIFVLLIEFAPGRTLDQLVQDLGPLPPKLVIEMARHVLEALAELHRLDLVHRDLKPENLMVQIMPSGRPFVRLLDFGIVKTIEHTRITEGFLGTPHFAAPEQALDSGSVDGRSDLYSLGCIMYYTITGDVPFPGDSSVAVLNAHLHAPVPPLPENDPSIPPELSEVVARLMAKEPVARPSTATELLRSPLFSGSVEAFEPDVVQYIEAYRHEAEPDPEPEQHDEPIAQPAGPVARPVVSPVILSAVTGDLKRAAVLTGRYELITWRTEGSPEPVATSLDPTEVARWMFYSVTGKYFFVVTKDGRVVVYEPATLERVKEFSLLPSNYKWVGPSRVDDELLLASTPGSLFRWNIGAGLTHLIEGEFILDVVLTRSLGRNTTILFERSTGRRLAVREDTKDATSFDVLWLTDSDTLRDTVPLDLAPFGQMVLWRDRTLIEANHHNNRTSEIEVENYTISAATLLADGNPICATNRGELIRVEIGAGITLLGTSISQVKSGTARGKAISFGTDGVASLWKLGQNEPVSSYQFAEPPVSHTLLWDLSPSLNQVAYIDTSAGDRVLTIRTYPEQTRDNRALELGVRIAAFRWSDDERSAFAITDQLEPLLVDLDTGACVEVRCDLRDPVGGCVVGAGRVVCVADRSGLVDAIDAMNGERLWRYHSGAPVTAMAASTKQNRVAVGRLDGTIQIVDSRTGSEVQTIQCGQESAVEQLRFSKGGTLMASYQSDGQVQLHNTELGRATYSAALNSVSQIINLAVDEEGSLIAYTQAGHSITQFDVEHTSETKVVDLSMKLA